MEQSEYQLLFAQLVDQTIQLIKTEYPNGISLTLSSKIDHPITPKGLFPAFYGCYDWHSAVHSHWQIVKALSQFPNAPYKQAVIDALNCSLTPENIAVEMEWINKRKGFEMPYGMAWLLILCDELKRWDLPEAEKWLDALRPMEAHAFERFENYCQKMPMPNRGGLHNQTAFSLSLLWDVAMHQEKDELQALISKTACRFYGSDTLVNLQYEPSAADFLSPSLAEADLMGRILDPREFEIWLTLFEPNGFAALAPVEVVDPSNGQLAHWAGLNFSRSWMLDSLSKKLPSNHRFVETLCENGRRHLEAALPLATHPAYMISHWVPTFAVYALTR